MEKSKWGKRVIYVLVALLIAAGIGSMIYLLAFRDKDPDVEYASAKEVLSAVSAELVDANKKIINAVNSGGTSSLSLSNMTTRAALPGFERGDMLDYYESNELPIGIIYAIDFIAQNATIENGFANGFEYGKTYSGTANGFGVGEGVVYVKANTQDNGVKFIVNYESEQSGQTFNYNLNFLVDYDFEENKVNKVSLNLVILPYVTEIRSIEYDFVNNSHSLFRLANYGTDFDSQTCDDIVTKYNSGIFTFDEAIKHQWSSVEMATANITDDINNLEFECYSYWHGNDSSSSVQQNILSNFYNALYSKMKGNKLLTSADILEIDKQNPTLVTYIAQAIDYGTNKASVETVGDSFYFTFVEYEDLVSYLTQVNTTIQQDQTARDDVKLVASSALGYIKDRGASKYTGELGTYNGKQLNIDYMPVTDWNSGVASNLRELITIDDGAGVVISFTLKNGEVSELEYANVLAVKFLYNTFYDYIVERLGDRWWGSASTDEINLANELLQDLNEYKDSDYLITGVSNWSFNRLSWGGRMHIYLSDRLDASGRMLQYSWGGASYSYSDKQPSLSIDC